MAKKLEQLESQLEQWQVEFDESANEQYLPMVKKLPVKLRTIAYALLERDAKGTNVHEYDFDDYEQSTKFYDEVRKKREDLEILSVKDREKIFAAFFPKLTKLMEKAWQALKKAPCSAGYVQRLFRFPNLPEATAEMRADWVSRFVDRLADYDRQVLDAQWLSEWSGYAFPYQTGVVTPVLVAAVNTKGKEGKQVFETLCSIARNEHPTARLGDHVIEALQQSEHSEGWALMEKTLLAAQRQEGLRQSIVGFAPNAHPEAFVRMLRIIQEENLLRFSSVARSFNLWFGLWWDSVSTKVLSEYAEELLEFMESPAACKKALSPKSKEDAERAYRALWALACTDAEKAVQAAKKLMKHEVDEVRYVALWLLCQIGIGPAGKVIQDAIEDENLQVAVLAAINADGLESSEDHIAVPAKLEDKGTFAKLEKLYDRLADKPQTLKAIVWPWTERKVKRSHIASAMLSNLGDHPPTKILPYLKGLSTWEYSQVISCLAAQKKWDKLTRETLFELAGHASGDVRSAAFDALRNQKLTAEDREQFETYLKRKSIDLRDNVIRMLRTGADQDVLASADRLLQAGDQGRRAAGLEMIRRMAENDQLREQSQALANELIQRRKKVTKEEQTQLDAIAASSEEQLTLENGLGMMDPKARSPVMKMTKKKVQLESAAVLASVKELDALIHQHRKEIVEARSWRGREEKPLGECEGYDFPNPNFRKRLKAQWEKFPLWEVWQEWYDNRPAKLKDQDKYELLRLHLALESWTDYRFDGYIKWCKKPANKKKAQATIGFYNVPKLKYQDIVAKIVKWLFHLHIPAGTADFCLDCSENALAQVSEAEMQTLRDFSAEEGSDDYHYYESDFEDPDWRNHPTYQAWMATLDRFLATTGSDLTKKQFQRNLEQLRFLDEPAEGISRKRIDEDDLWVRAIQEKLVNRHDIIDALIGAERGQYGGYSLLSQLTSRSKFAREAFEKCAGLEDIVVEVRDRLLEIELARGEKATAASEPALSIDTIPGARWLFRIMEALGKEKFKKNTSWQRQTRDIRSATLTALVASTQPIEEDTPAEFAKLTREAIKAGYCDEAKILQLAFLAPQWSKLIESFLKWEGFGEGIYWFIAHMDTWASDAESAAAAAEGIEEDNYEEEEDDDFDDEADDETGDSIPKPKKLTPWEKLVLERTPLTDEERGEGAVDVAWFDRTWKILGTKRWTQLAEAAKFAANSAQARKAQFLADVLLGNTTKTELVKGIEDRKLKENVRLLGLLPLAKGAQTQKDVEDRYEVLQAYKKYARTLSGLTKPEAMRALEIGFENLARLAGYQDPLRLEWAMEAESVRDLAKGPVSITKDGVTVTLRLTEDAKPELTVQRGDRTLKSIPAKTRKKYQEIADLNDRGKELRKKASRIKHSLEAAMCRVDTFTGAELLTLCQHALLAPQLQRLVLVGEGIMGYPDKGGKALRDFRGKLEPVKKSETLRIAHPTDLLASKNWHKWQSECFQAERVQPFKQVFRELYVATAQEKKELEGSSRFAGQQIGPRQAMALWGSRGWNTRDEVFKTFHAESLVAEVGFQWDYGTAAEVEGLTVEQVRFRKTDEFKPLKLSKVPPQIFSEVMRDVDLVVSVAHRGEVDPEASASTVEMRASLIGETCKLLGIKNVDIKKQHALIDGEYAEYSLHLGSGNVQRIPGGALAILPVHAQHRGRLFLPFADDDPRTAEVISKVLLLARDGEIQDPMILDQLAVPVGRRKTIVDEPASEKTSGPAKGSAQKTKASQAGSAKTSAGETKHFEFEDGKSKKFWEIAHAGTTVTTKWGRIGTKGQTKTKSFEDEASARAEYDKLIKSKINKGYTES